MTKCDRGTGDLKNCDITKVKLNFFLIFPNIYFRFHDMNKDKVKLKIGILNLNLQYSIPSAGDHYVNFHVEIFHRGGFSLPSPERIRL